MQSQECMSLLYNLRKMVYESEGFSKAAARRTSWQDFIDNFIHPERTYVEEPDKVAEPETKQKIMTKKEVLNFILRVELMLFT